MDQKDSIKKFKRMLKLIDLPVSAGITGSTALRTENKNSDVDAWICIDKTKIPEFISNLKENDFFDSKSQQYLQKNLHLLEKNKIQVINIKNMFNNINWSVDIYTIETFIDICTIPIKKIKRKRQNNIKKKKIVFKNIRGDALYIHCKNDKDYSTIPIAVQHKKQIYIGQHLDRLLISRIVIDKHNIINHLIILWIKIISLMEKEKKIHTKIFFGNQKLDRKKALDNRLIAMKKGVRACQSSLILTDTI